MCAKYLLNLIFIIAVVQAVELKPSTLECAEKSNVSEEVVNIIKRGTGVVPVDNLETQDFVQCVIGQYFDQGDQVIISSAVREFYNGFLENLELSENLTRTAQFKCKHIKDESQIKYYIHMLNCVIKQLEDFKTHVKSFFLRDH